MGQYATIQDLRAYIEGSVTGTSKELEALIEKAELEVDRVLGPRPVLSTGLKLQPVLLQAWQRQRLARATAAQVEYMITARGQDPNHDILPSPQSVSGPDFSVNYGNQPGGGLPAVAPRAVRLLQDAGLVKRWTSTSGGGGLNVQQNPMGWRKNG